MSTPSIQYFTWQRLRILRMFLDADGPLTITRIIEEGPMNRRTATDNLRAMEASGWVHAPGQPERVPGRRRHYMLTPEGCDVAAWAISKWPTRGI